LRLLYYILIIVFLRFYCHLEGVEFWKACAMKSILFRWKLRIINGFVCVISYSDPDQVWASQSLCWWGTLQPSLCEGLIIGFCSKKELFAIWPNNYLVVSFWDSANCEDLPCLELCIQHVLLFSSSKSKTLLKSFVLMLNYSFDEIF
jgi:hypothetical protein